MLASAISNRRRLVACGVLVVLINVAIWQRLFFRKQIEPPPLNGNSWVTYSHNAASLPACAIPPVLQDRMAAAKKKGSAYPPSDLRHITGFLDAFGPSKDCYTRASRVDPYGFERDEDDFWATFKWEELIDACSRRNGLPQPKDLNAPEILMMPDALKKWGEIKSGTVAPSIPKTAVIIRAYEGADYSGDMIPYLRSLILELNLQSGGQYQVFLFIEIKEVEGDIYSDRERYDKLLEESVPPEFRGIAYLWNKSLLKAWYPAIEKHSVYYQEYQGLQLFATMVRPDFDFFWQLEMDVRFTGPHLHMLQTIGDWAKNRTREGLADLNSSLYMPSMHGSWDDFVGLVKSDRKFPHFSQHSAYGSTLGSGEEADLITTNPIVDIRNTEWIFRDEVFNDPTPHLPRLVAPVAITRTSKPLLQLIHDLQTTIGFAIGSEATPETVSARFGKKAVYFPHPVYYGGELSDKDFHEMQNPGLTRGYGPFNNKENQYLSFWWRSLTSQNIWEGVLSAGDCLPPSLIHPFKVGDRAGGGGGREKEKENRMKEEERIRKQQEQKEVEEQARQQAGQPAPEQPGPAPGARR